MKVVFLCPSLSVYILYWKASIMDLISGTYRLEIEYGSIVFVPEVDLMMGLVKFAVYNRGLFSRSFVLYKVEKIVHFIAHVITFSKI